MRNLFVILSLFYLLLVGCQQDENVPKASTSSGDNTTPSTNNAIGLTLTGWRFYVVGNTGNILLKFHLLRNKKQITSTINTIIDSTNSVHENPSMNEQ